MGALFVDDQLLDENDPRMQAALQALYGLKKRPRCACRPERPYMYIARFGDSYIVKRMPNTGDEHSPDCDSFEPPAELSGLSGLLDRAIKENDETGEVSLKLDFSLSRSGQRMAPSSSVAEKVSIKARAAKLTLRGFFHYLWEQAGLNRWYPAMAGKRDWFVVRKYVLEAAAHKEVKGQELTNWLVIPEVYHRDRAKEQAERRYRALVNGNDGKTHQLKIVIGEVYRADEKNNFGYRLEIRHWPHFALQMRPEVLDGIHKHFKEELELKELHEDCHLFCCCTVSCSNTGLAFVEEITLMVTTKEYHPIESECEYQLLSELVKQGQRFRKCLRYNLPHTAPLPSVLRLEPGKEPVVMYVQPPNCSDQYKRDLAMRISDSKLIPWMWDWEQSSSVPSLDEAYRPAVLDQSPAEPNREGQVLSENHDEVESGVTPSESSDSEVLDANYEAYQEAAPSAA